MVPAVTPLRSLRHGPKLRPGLTPPIASRSITPGYLQLLGYEKRFHTAWTRCGHSASTVTMPWPPGTSV